MKPVLEVKGLVKHYPGAKALDGVDFDVLPGEVHCLLGPNGAGKSTLIKCVSGAVAPTEGAILVGGEPLPTSNRAPGGRDRPNRKLASLRMVRNLPQSPYSSRKRHTPSHRLRHVRTPSRTSTTC